MSVSISSPLVKLRFLYYFFHNSVLDVCVCVCVCLYEGWKFGEGRGEGFLPRVTKLKQGSRKGWNIVRKIVKEKYTYYVLKKRCAWLPFIEVS